MRGNLVVFCYHFLIFALLLSNCFYSSLSYYLFFIILDFFNINAIFQCILICGHVNVHVCPRAYTYTQTYRHTHPDLQNQTQTYFFVFLRRPLSAGPFTHSEAFGALSAVPETATSQFTRHVKELIPLSLGADCTTGCNTRCNHHHAIKPRKQRNDVCLSSSFLCLTLQMHG